MKRKRFVSLALVAMLSAGLLTGCGPEDVSAEVSEDVETITEQIMEIDSNANQLEHYDEIPETREYQPYEHIFFKRFVLNENDSAQSVIGGSIVVPDGYEIVKIENFTMKYGYGSRTGGVDIWFTNTVAVSVDPVYNSFFGYYDYSHEGKVIELEDDSSLKLIP